MLHLSDVREGIATALATTGLRTYAYVPEAINAPCAVVEVPEFIDYNRAMAKGLDEMLICAYVFVASTSDRAGQRELEKYADGSGQYSIREAIWNDRTLNGAVSSIHIKSLDEFGSRTVGNSNYLQFKATFVVLG